jgi:hypothetical protein
MIKILKSILFIFLGLNVLYISSCTKDGQPDCKWIYPEYESTIDTTIFDFQWCAVEGATKYHIQADVDLLGIEPFLYDTIVEQTTIKSTLMYQSMNDPNLISEGTPFEWRVAPIIEGQQGEWSEVYTFKTWDARDKIVGTHTLDKYIYKHTLGMSGYAYISDYLGTGQVKVEKVEGTKNIRVTEIGGNNLSEELNNSNLNSWSKTYNVYPNGLVTYPNDSIEIVFMTNPGDSIPWGYYFGGHY